MAYRPPTGTTLLLAVALLAAGLAGCAAPDGPGTNETPDGNQDSPPGSEDPPADDSEPERTTIAWDRLPAPASLPRANASRLVDLVDRQVYDNGTGEPRYRTPGTEGHEATIPVLEAMLEGAGASVHRERFTVELGLGIGEVNATNVYGVREGTADSEIWLAAHWDSRAKATAALNDSRTDRPVLGANDGAAAVAVVVHALELLPETNATIRVALFDAEDQGQGASGWIEGSSYAADQTTAEQREEIEAFLLVDMPGHEDLSIRREKRSHTNSPHVTDLAFGVAERLGASSFHNETGPPILDDHVPFLERGVPAVDLIHLDRNGTGAFPWTWHTPHDTPKHLSGDSMAEVTRVLVGTALAADRGALPPAS